METVNFPSMYCCNETCRAIQQLDSVLSTLKVVLSIIDVYARSTLKSIQSN